MYNQLRVECFKLRHFPLLYVAAVCMAALGFMYGYKIETLGLGVYDAFAESNCDTSFMFLSAMVSAWFIGNDFSSRTIHHEITLGYSRLSVIVARELLVYLSAFLLHFAYIAFTILGTAVKTGFSANIFGMQDVLWCVTILLQLMALQSIVALISFLCAKATAAVALSVCFTFITCNILRNFFDGKIFTTSCFCLARDAARGTLLPAGIAAALTVAAMVSLTYAVFRKKEIR